MAGRMEQRVVGALSLIALSATVGCGGSISASGEPSGDPASSAPSETSAAPAASASASAPAAAPTTVVPAPTSAKPLVDAIEIAAGTSHTCALRADGTVACWGSNTLGQIGQDMSRVAGSSRPMTVPGLPPIAHIAAGGSTSCAIDGAGGLWCWGANDAGQLGQGRIEFIAWSSPLKIAAADDGALPPVLDVVLRSQHVCAATAAGAYCWGSSAYGEAGALDAVVGLPHAVARGAALEVSAGASHSCVRGDQGVACWGRNDSGELGAGDAGPARSSSPVTVAIDRAARIEHVVSGRAHTCALDASGRVYCWGENNAGQISDDVAFGVDALGAAAHTGVPHRLGEFADLAVASIAAGGDTTCVIDAERRVVCFGDGSRGQLGDGAFSTYPRPAPRFTPVEGALAVAVGRAHACAIVRAHAEDAFGYVSCWGADDVGQLGDGETRDSALPTRALDP